MEREEREMNVCGEDAERKVASACACARARVCVFVCAVVSSSESQKAKQVITRGHFSARTRAHLQRACDNIPRSGHRISMFHKLINFNLNTRTRTHADAHARRTHAHARAHSHPRLQRPHIESLIVLRLISERLIVIN